MSTDEVRVRIAPSPTGDPHVGTAYVALFNYAFARRRGGKFILRIEDTDRARSTRASEEAIMRSLRWLGLQWDEGPDVGGPYGPYRQSERGELYREQALALVASGQAFRCFCTPERLAELRASQKGQSFIGYDGSCRELDPGESADRARGGEPHVIRLKMPREGQTVLRDLLRGEVVISNEQSDDQVLLKSDGMPTYHLANVVDDHMMRVSHVVRAEEWISSVPKHLRLYEAFGWEPPAMAHLPLLRNADKNKSKISKRRNPVSLEYYRESGILPAAMVNFLALMGWSFGGDQEKFTLEEMVARFDIAPGTISLSGPVFDLDKLAWLNGHYLRELSDEALVDELVAWRLNKEYLARLAPLVRERIRRLDEFVPMTDYFFAGDLDYSALTTSLVPKKRDAPATAKMLARLGDHLDGLRSWAPDELETALRAFAEEEGWSTKELFMTLRLVVTGRSASPPLFETMAVVGRERCRRRVAVARAFLRGQK